MEGGRAGRSDCGVSAICFKIEATSHLGSIFSALLATGEVDLYCCAAFSQDLSFLFLHSDVSTYIYTPVQAGLSSTYETKSEGSGLPFRNHKLWTEIM